MNHINHYITTAKTFVTTYRKECIIIASALGGMVVIGILAALFIYNNPPRVVYQPVEACKLFTPAEAQDLLGEKVIGVDTKAPVISGDMATSKCSYTDTNPEASKMRVAAIAVRSGVNDRGIEQNKTAFGASTPNEGIETVREFGETAYYNPAVGQLHILRGREWIILSYGIGSAPETNTLDKAVELAKKVLE